ncbi:MAG: SGNH/GDSL hydrolase family protein [Microcoleus sp. PH2017_17_BER_D_A]|nr:SGNH/GDSL hydrolase family protein [Microcoleus sp. PH2017_17_BER_D_A]
MTLSKHSILLTALLLLVLGSSIFLNILLFSRAKQYYRELNQTRLDPLGLNNHPINAQPVTNTKQTRVVFFGDSRAASWTSPNLGEYEFINRGIGSQTSVQAIERFAYHVSSLKPKIVIIQVGVNDLKTIPLFPESRNAIVANCQANIKRISRAIKEVNAYIATLAGEKIIVFDTFPILGDSQGMILRKYSSDELHLNAQGYAILNENLSPLLNTSGQKKVQN